jgi:hypothetical protein
MNMDKIFDQMERNPLKVVGTMWAVAALWSILSIVVVAACILGLLKLFGVI